MAYKKDEDYQAETYPVPMFLDIETVRGQKEFSDLSGRLRHLYMDRNWKQVMRDEDDTNDTEHIDFLFSNHYRNNAGFSSEFGKVVAISMGMLSKVKTETGTEWKFFIRSLTNRDEKQLLLDFKKAISKAAPQRLCAHNGKEFDFPYLFRRMIINGVDVPLVLTTIGKKSYDLPLEDTMVMYSGSAWNFKISLDLACELLGIPSSKNEMKGEDVGPLYWMDDLPASELSFDENSNTDRKTEDLKKIGTYCNGDIFANANLYCKLRGFEPIREDQIVYLS